jgi:WhiB family redox-sensing transcriptional regulator
VTARDWRDDAACTGHDPGMWDDDRPADHPHAKAICARCPVAADCLTDAKTTSDEHGIRAGLTGEQRRVLRLGRLAANRMPAHKWVPIAEEALRADPAGATFATIAAATNRDRTTVNQGLARAGRDDLRAALVANSMRMKGERARIRGRAS